MEGYYAVSLSSIVESLFVLEIESNRIAVALPYSECRSGLQNSLIPLIDVQVAVMVLGAYPIFFWFLFPVIRISIHINQSKTEI
jgi:hypothetical protein